MRFSSVAPRASRERDSRPSAGAGMARAVVAVRARRRGVRNFMLFMVVFWGWERSGNEWLRSGGLVDWKWRFGLVPRLEDRDDEDVNENDERG